MRRALVAKLRTAGMFCPVPTNPQDTSRQGGFVKHSRLLPLAVAFAAGISLSGCAPDGTAPVPSTPSFSAVDGSGTSYVILGKANKLPADLATRISQAGGTLTATVSQIGMATATSSDPTFQSKIA